MADLRRGLCIAICALTLTGCSTGGTSQSASTSGSGSAGAGSELAAGLLTSAAFGTGYTATALDAAQVASFDPTSSLQAFTITPPECQTVVNSFSPFVRATELAAQSVVGTDPSAANYAEVIATGLAAMALDLPALRILLSSCTSVSLTGSDGTQVTTSYQQTDVGVLGDDRVALRTTATVTANGQSQQVVGNNLLATDGDRVLALVALATTAEAADLGFPALAEAAFTAQHDALG